MGGDQHPIVRLHERELVRNAFLPLGGRVLALAHPEGATYEPLDQSPLLTMAHACSGELPFDDGTFDHVLVRDVLHRLPEPAHRLSELHRVLRPRGRLDVLEASGRNPLIAARALSRSSERALLDSTARHLERLVARRFVLMETSRHQPMPLHRALFPRVTRSPHHADSATARAVAALERFLGFITPRDLWAYIHVRARRA